MRILLVFAHYFSGEDNPRHASTDLSRQDDRRLAIESAILAWRGHFGTTAVLDVGNKAFHLGPRSDHTVDIVVATTNDKHLMTPEFCAKAGAQVAKFEMDNPRMLGFKAQEVFASLRNSYDMFVFSEDDLKINDAQIVDKLAWFNQTFGYKRVLFPNRVEWNRAGPALKTYIDGDLAGRVSKVMKSFVADDEVLYGSPLGQPASFQRARNPHSGFFAVTRDQLSYWIDQPHWLDRDCNFVSPLESSATLGIAKTFSIYKPYGHSASFLEIEHLDSRFTGMKLPVRTRL